MYWKVKVKVKVKVKERQETGKGLWQVVVDDDDQKKVMEDEWVLRVHYC